jgi:hypothetical protein
MLEHRRCHECQKVLHDGNSVYLLTSARYRQRMTERPEFGWDAHVTPIGEWCNTCGSRFWSNIGGECPFCQDAFIAGTEVICLVSGTLPKAASLSLGERCAQFVAHKRCFENHYPDFSN